MNPVFWIVLAFGIGFLIGIIFVAIAIKKLGTLQIDMKSPDDEGIARFVFDIPIEDAAKHKIMFVRIDEARNLRSIK